MNRIRCHVQYPQRPARPEKRKPGSTVRGDHVAWTDEQMDLIRRLYPTTASRKIGKMIGRSKTAVVAFANKNGIFKVDSSGPQLRAHLKAKSQEQFGYAPT